MRRWLLVNGAAVAFRDQRHRLVEKNVPLSQVRDVLGRCSIVVTERYDRQVLATLQEAAGKLDDGQPCKNLFNLRRAALRCRLDEFHALNTMPGWRNWQTHRT